MTSSICPYCLIQDPFLKYQERVPTEVEMTFRDLAAECYWLGCLMAFNNPPLQPDWESHIPGPDAWNIFPPAIKLETRSNAIRCK